jgi:hypothetical protein
VHRPYGEIVVRALTRFAGKRLSEPRVAVVPSRRREIPMSTTTNFEETLDWFGRVCARELFLRTVDSSAP